MKIKVILYGVGLTDVTGDRWKENARICNRIHLPIEGKAIYHDVREDCVLAAEDAYLLINSSSANLELLPDTPYQHMYIDFQTVPPLAGSEVLKINLSEDELLFHLLGAIRALLSENKRKNNRVAIIKGRDEDLHSHAEGILKVIIAYLQRIRLIKPIENARVEEVLKYIGEHYTERIGNGEIANKMHMNARYLIRLFKRNTGMSPYQYLTQYRIERAIEELSAGKSVTETAFDCGYQSENAFRLAFRRVMGETPKNYLIGKNDSKK